MGGINWYVTALIMGLAGSLHCLGMCGPIFFAAAGFYDKPSAFALPVIWHHLGKIISYAGIGLAMGIIGQGISLLWFQNQVMIICGILLIAVAAGSLLKFPWLTAINHWVGLRMGTILGKKSGGFLLGLVNGLIPCGLVYAAAVGAAATQNVFNGALFMVFFGIGTIPALTLVGFSRWLIRMPKIKNLAVWKQVPAIILGLWLLLKGLGLGIPYISPDLGSHEPAKNCCREHISTNH